MMPTPHDVAKVIELNGGELIGRTRLQKTLYFLERLELGFGFDFQYHHYGPFSDELATAAEDAVALHLIAEETRIGNQLQLYSVFRSAMHSPADALDARRRAALNVLSAFDAVSLELAATADYLSQAGFIDGWAETAVRKASKASPERIQRARNLLGQLQAA